MKEREEGAVVDQKFSLSFFLPEDYHQVQYLMKKML